ncbi:MAG: GGDEF domain-containing protein [Terracidiphilus sp.]
MLLAAALALPGAAAGPTPLTSLSQIHLLTNAQASQRLPVAFEATVTYDRSFEGTIFVEDAGAAIYVQPAQGTVLAPGDRILIQGTTHASFRPYVNATSIRFLRHGSLPIPIPATFRLMVQAELDCHFVTVRGQVRLAQMVLSSGRPVTDLQLLMDGGYAEVTIDSGEPAHLDGLLDAEVEITGAESGQFDGKMQQTGILLHTQSFDQVKILHRAVVDPWALPLTPMGEVLTAFDHADRSQRVRVEGTLTYYQPASMAVLQDRDRSIRVLTPEITPLRVGDLAEATGIPFVDNGFLTLKLGTIRSKGAAQAVVPNPSDWDGLASGKHAFDLVSIEGKVITQVREHAQDVYMIESSGHLFPVSLRHPFVYVPDTSQEPPPLAVIPPGSRVRVTGVVLMDNGNPFAGAVAFGILLRTAADVQVVERPSWWTVQHLAYLATILLGLLLAGLGWVWILDRKVRRQTAALTASIASEAALTQQNAELERRRGLILEQISLREPLGSTLGHIAEFVTSRLNGIPSWFELSDGACYGDRPANADDLQVLEAEIPARSGQRLGSLMVALPQGEESTVLHHEGLTNGTRLAKLAIETRALYSDLVHRSEFDLLTDVPNRFALEKHMEAMIEEARSSSSLLGLIYIDLDEFKQVNDLYGHHIGDLYLQEAALRMKRQLRSMDVLARLGGDEFAVLVPAVRDRARLEEIAMRLERSFDAALKVDQFSLQGSASFGVALYPEDGASSDTLLSAADAAMYRTKRGKRANGETPQAAPPAGAVGEEA